MFFLNEAYHLLWSEIYILCHFICKLSLFCYEDEEYWTISKKFSHNKFELADEITICVKNLSFECKQGGGLEKVWFLAYKKSLVIWMCLKFHTYLHMLKNLWTIRWPPYCPYGLCIRLNKTTFWSHFFKS